MQGERPEEEEAEDTVLEQEAGRLVGLRVLLRVLLRGTKAESGKGEEGARGDWDNDNDEGFGRRK